MKKALWLFSFALILNGANSFIKDFSWKSYVKKDHQIAKNAILFIGDGMGQAFLTASRIYQGGSKSKLFMENLPVVGYSRTYASDDFVTDSAAAASAMATGVKTYNGSVSMSDPKLDSSGESKELRTFVDAAVEGGKSVGIITTTKIMSATPAAFYAHAKSRDDDEGIATQLMGQGVTLYMGGGRKYMYPPTWKDPQEGKPGKRTDGRNIVEEMKAKGWTYIETKDQLPSIQGKEKVLALFEHSSMDADMDRDDHEPSLSEMTEAAIKFLSKNENGFVLIVESAKIDTFAHTNQTKLSIGEVLHLDRAVKKASDMTEEDTLIVVTADHETGGLAISGYGDVDKVKGESFLNGVKGNAWTDLPEEQRQACLEARRTWDADTIRRLRCEERTSLSWATGPGAGVGPHTNVGDLGHMNDATFNEPIAHHTAADVPVLAGGPSQYLFTGFMDNSDIAKKMAKALGIEF